MNVKKSFDRLGPWTMLVAGIAAALLATVAIPAIRDDGLSLAARIDVGTQPGQIQAAGDGLWVSVMEGIRRVDTRSNKVVGSFPGSDDFAYSFFDVGTDGVWIQQGGVSTEAPIAVVRLDPSSGATREVGRYRNEPHGVAVSDGAVWTIDISGELTKLDATSGETVGHASIGWPLWSVAAGEGALWVAGGNGVARVEPSSGRVVTMIPLPEAQDVAAGNGSVWVVQAGTKTSDARVVRIDPRTNEIIGSTPIPHAKAVATGPDAVWVVSELPATLTRINPATGAVVSSIKTGSIAPVDVAVADGAVWVAECCIGGALLRFD